MTDIRQKIFIIVKVIAFMFCLGLVILGHEYIGIYGTLTQLIGLAGILAIIGIYNSKYK